MSMQSNQKTKEYLNPYIAGVLLGLTLLASFVLLGAGLGASGGLARVAAALEGSIAGGHTLNSEYFGKWGESPMNYYLVYMLVGTFLGGLFSSVASGRVVFGIERGRMASLSLRTKLSLFGGIIVGFAGRLAQGCTSGQALTGGAMLLTGSIIFLVCIFIGGYGAAYFVRSQWND